MTATTAIHYDVNDYATTLRRLIAALTDLVAVLLVILIVNYAFAYRYVPADVLRMPVTTAKERATRQARINEHMRPIQVSLLAGILLSIAAYHIGMRRLHGGTLGYRLAGVRIVDATGRPPQWKTLVRRFLIALPFVSFFGVTYLLCRQNPRKQSFHDQWSGTWVVRKAASPAGPAKVVYQSKLLGTFPLTYIDLEPDESSPAQQAVS